MLRPVKPSEPDFLARLREIAPDCCPVAAYGALIPQSALDIPAHGWVNLHFSILPAWRGAAPVQHAILHGDDLTGATTFRIVRELDAGPVFGVLTEPIRPSDTAGDLLDRLSTSAPNCWWRRWTGSSPVSWRRASSPPTASAWRPKITPADARSRLAQASHRDRPPDPRVHARAGRVDSAGGRPGQAVAGELRRAVRH